MTWIEALTPIISAIIGVISYSTLTNYRLDKLDKQVDALSSLADRITKLEVRVDNIENNVNHH